jgi:hypothetical protein
MKLIKRSIIQSGLSLGAVFLAANLCLGSGAESSDGQKQPSETKAVTTAKKRASAAQAAERRVEVTGSRIRYRVKGGKQLPETGLSVTVIDTKSAVNRGYSSPLDALLQNPSVYRGR